MKTAILKTVILYLILMPASVGAQTSDPPFWFITDSIQSYSYNSLNDTWDFSGATYNFYLSGNLDSTITAGSNRQPQANTIYSYENGVIKEALSLVLNAGIWVQSQHQSFIYDSYGLLSERVVTKWDGTQWQNLNRFNYTYNINNQLLRYDRAVWRNDSWTDFSVDSLFYNIDNLLFERSARLLSSGDYLTRILYDYDQLGKASYQTRQNYLNGNWVNASRVSYLYDPCGNQNGTITESWIEGAWRNVSKNVIFLDYIVNPDVKKVPICFNGITIYIKKTVIDSYLRRGACLGECLSSKNGKETKGEEAQQQPLKAPFTVYPVPATDKITISQTESDFIISRVELIDWSGNTLKVINQPDNGDITIYRAGLKSGQYIVRVYSDQVFSIVVVFN
jgi:hypothetical protein